MIHLCDTFKTTFNIFHFSFNKHGQGRLLRHPSPTSPSFQIFLQLRTVNRLFWIQMLRHVLISCVLWPFKATQTRAEEPQRCSNFPLCPPHRSDRAALSPTSSAFTRETADPLTQAPEPQFKAGTETQRIMGKEVREERRLESCAVSSFGIFVWLRPVMRFGNR